MGTLSPKFLDTLRKHLEIGTSLRHINMSDEQKKRVTICMELYNLLKQNPYLNKEEWLKNKYGRTYWEIRNDKECLDYIISVLDAGGKNISRFIVKTTYEKAIQMAHEQGDVKNMIAGASKLSDLEKLTEPEQGEDLENSITKLPYVFVDDARKVLPGKSYSNSAQMERLRKKWGVQKDSHQEMVDRKAEELQAKISEEELEAKDPLILVTHPETARGFDLSLLDASQLQALQTALNARVMAVQREEEESRSDDCSDDLDDEDEY